MSEHKKHERDAARGGRKPDEKREPAAGSFSGDIGGGGTGIGADLGRGGTTTPTGDIAGGGEPGSLVDVGDGTVSDPDAIPTGGAGATTSRDRQIAGRGGTLPEPPRDLPRTATDMTPGIPEGSGKGIENALRQPDTDLGGGVAGDTTPAGETDTKPDRQVVRNEDKERTTL